jgi:hypothetical protein
MDMQISKDIQISIDIQTYRYLWICRYHHINLDDAFLYCYLVGQEWFGDVRDPFGNVKSEYMYAGVVAVLKFGFGCDRKFVEHGSRVPGI